MNKAQAIESYFKTANKRLNNHTFKMLCEVIQKGNFTNLETPLQILSKAVDIFTEHSETPVKAIQMFEAEVDKQNLDTGQKLFVFEWALKYVDVSEYVDVSRFLGVSKFEKTDFGEIKELLKSKTERLKDELNKLPEYNNPLTRSIQNTLKDLIHKELEQLPETLQNLSSMQRLNILCKLMPFVLPKTEIVISNPSPLDRLPTDKKNLYMALPDTFTTGEGVQVAQSMGMPERTFKRLLSNRELFSNHTWGKYEKRF